jgi:F420-non-reducing hydrogenase iron-sulfur subunit
MTIKRITFVQELLAFVGLEGRLHLAWISSAEAQKFVRVITDFTEKIRTLGPNPLAGFNATLNAAGVKTAAGLANRHQIQPLKMESTHCL